MGIQFGGLASGLDTDAIIRALVAVRSRPIALLERQREGEKEKITQIGLLEDLVEKLEDKAQELTKLGGFFDYAVEPADPDVVSLNVTGSVTPGAHTVTVNTLASAARYTFETVPAVADPDADQFGAGQITFTYEGTAYTVDVAAGSSLNDIAAAITAEAGEVVAVSVVNTGPSSSPDHQLVLTGRDTGAEFDLVDLAAEDSIGLGTLTSLTTASNAEIVVDGLTVQRSSNLFDGVLEGLSITALAEGASTSFTAEIDVEATRSTLQGFVDAYNEVIEFINDQSSFSEENGPSGVLFGDRILRSVSSTLHGALFTPDLQTVLNDPSGYSTLGLVGIDLNDDGTLTIDADQLEEKLAGDPEAFAALFTDLSSGVLVELDGALDNLLDGVTLSGSGETLDSPFTGRRKALGSIISSIDDQVERLQYNLERYEESLVLRFANLEQVLGGLNSQSAFLAANPFAL
jgi:flagellar hook-associated protein 2